MANERNLRQGLKSLANSDIKGQLSITGAGASVPMVITGATNTILEMRDQASGDVLSLFKSNGDELFKVKTDGITVGGNYTLPLTDGTAGQALTTDGSGAISFATPTAQSAFTITCKVSSATGTMSAGNLVAIDGVDGGVPTIRRADNDNSSARPAIGFAHSSGTTGDSITVTIGGIFEGADTSSVSAGDPLYLSNTPGAVTSSKPNASTGFTIQPVGYCVVSDASAGKILVQLAPNGTDYLTELRSLSGVSRHDTDLGTFTGTTIADNQDIKEALQALETAVEGSSGGASSLNDLSDVTVSGTPAAGDVLVYNSVGSVFEHSAPAVPTLQEVTDSGLSTSATIVAGNYTTTGNVTAIGTGNNTFSGNINASGGVTVLDSDLSKSLTLKSTDSTASTWGALNIFRSSSSPLDDDLMSNINFNGEDSVGTDTTYASIQGVLRDPTNTTEDGGLNLRVKANNAWTSAIQINADDGTPTTTINNFSGKSTALNIYNDGGSASCVIQLDADMSTTSTNATGINYVDATGSARNAMRIENGKTILNNRTANSDIELRANNASAGAAGEVTYITVDGSAGKIGFHNNAYKFPTADGSANQVLQTDGSGNLSFATASGSNRMFYFHESVTNIVSTAEDTYYWYPGGSTQGIRDDYGSEHSGTTGFNWNQFRRTGHQLPAGTYDITFNVRIAVSGNSTGSSANGAYATEDVNVYLYNIEGIGGTATFQSQVGSTQTVTLGTNTHYEHTATITATGVTITADEVLIPMLKGNTVASSTAYVMWDYTLDAEKTA